MLLLYRASSFVLEKTASPELVLTKGTRLLPNHSNRVQWPHYGGSVIHFYTQMSMGLKIIDHIIITPAVDHSLLAEGSIGFILHNVQLLYIELKLLLKMVGTCIVSTLHWVYTVQGYL
jgi:hypothetical protein